MSSINNLKNKSPQDIVQSAPPRKNEKVFKAAQMYEQQFLREMLKAMRDTVQESELLPVSQGEKIYREQMDHHYVEKWGERGGVGLADMIYNHLMERYFSQQKIQTRPQGPIPLDSKGTYKLHPSQSKPINGTDSSKGANLFLERVNAPSGKGSEPVVAPWSGSITYESEQEGFIQARIKHEDGTVSRLRFEGMKSADISLEGTVKAGQKIGSLSPEARGIFWSIETKT